MMASLLRDLSDKGLDFSSGFDYITPYVCGDARGGSFKTSA